MSKRKLVPRSLGESLEAIQRRHRAGEPHKVLTAEEIGETRAMIEAAANFKPAAKRMLSTEQVADAFGVTAQTIRNWEEQGKLVPAEKTSDKKGGHRRYTEKQIIEFKKKQMGVPQILIPDLKPKDLVVSIQQFLSNFDPEQAVDVTIQVDEEGRKVTFIVTSEDGLLSQAKTLKMED